MRKGKGRLKFSDDPLLVCRAWIKSGIWFVPVVENIVD